MRGRAAAVDAAEQLRHAHRQVQGTISLALHSVEDLLVQRMLSECSPKGLSLLGVGSREHPGATHEGRGGDRIVQPGDVQHRRHLGEASARVTQE